MNASRRDHWCTNYYFHFTENRKLQFRKIWKASQVVHACNPSIPGDWSRRTIILGPVGQFSTLLRENLSQHEKFKRAVDVAQVKVYSPKLWGKKKKKIGELGDQLWDRTQLTEPGEEQLLSREYSQIPREFHSTSQPCIPSSSGSEFAGAGRSSAGCLGATLSGRGLSVSKWWIKFNEHSLLRHLSLLSILHDFYYWLRILSSSLIFFLQRRSSIFHLFSFIVNALFQFTY